jgi:hypothetical protein
MDTMPMSELLVLFEMHMSIHGRQDLLRVIRNAGNSAIPAEEAGDGDGDDHRSDGEYSDDSGDVSIDSPFGDDIDTDSNDCDYQSENNSIASAHDGIGVNQNIVLHNPVVHGHHHCPLFAQIDIL